MPRVLAVVLLLGCSCGDPRSNTSPSASPSAEPASSSTDMVAVTGSAIWPEGDPCTRTPNCPIVGACRTVKGQCRAEYDADCRFACSGFGRCVAKDGECIALTREHCAQGEMCKGVGKCAPKAGECVVETDDDCAKSSGCKFAGECHAQGGNCAPKSDEDCKASENCKNGGLCWLTPASEFGGDRTECRAKTEDDCRKAPACAAQGDCSITEEKLCRPKDDADCARSAICKEKKLCKKGVGATPRYGCKE